MFTLGREQGLEFGSVRAAVFVSDSVLAVSDFAGRNVRLFGPDGSFLRFVGGEGTGPGEFRRPSSLAARGDSFVIIDGLGRRLLTYAASGELLRQEDLPGDLPSVGWYGPAGTGHFAVTRQVSAPPPQHGFSLDSVEVRIRNPSGAEIVLDTVAGALRFYDTRHSISVWNVPHAPNVRIGVLSGGFAIGDGVSPVTVLSGGSRAVAFVPEPFPGYEPGGSTLERWEQAVLARARTEQSAEFAREMRRAPRTQQVQYGDISTDHDDRIWVPSFRFFLEPHTHYRVYDADGGLVESSEWNVYMEHLASNSERVAFRVWGPLLEELVQVHARRCTATR